MWQIINPLTYTNLPNQDSDIILATWKPFSQQGESSHRWSDQLLVTLPRQVGLTIPSFRYFSLVLKPPKSFQHVSTCFYKGSILPVPLFFAAAGCAGCAALPAGPCVLHCHGPWFNGWAVGCPLYFFHFGTGRYPTNRIKFINSIHMGLLLLGNMM